MPIKTNLAVCTQLFHVPIPYLPQDMGKIKDACKNIGILRGKITPKFSKTKTSHIVSFQIEAPTVLEAIEDGNPFWKTLGKLIKTTKEPWWDLCAVIKDNTPRKNAHALSIYRVRANGTVQYLLSEEPEIFGDILTQTQVW